jgi:dienelactone hydrolase
MQYPNVTSMGGCSSRSTFVVAFHGDFASPAMLRRDMGVNWVDHYWDYKRDDCELLTQPRELVLVAFSRGGSLVGKLASRLDNIRAAILYEAPLLDASQPAGDFPVLLIWNRFSIRRFTPQARRSRLEWAAMHEVTEFQGRGFHIKFWPPGHGWDQRLNPRIEAWLQLKAR